MFRVPGFDKMETFDRTVLKLTKFETVIQPLDAKETAFLT